MARLDPPNPATMDPEQREVYDQIASGPRKGVRGPLAVWLRRAEFAGHAQRLGQYCRYNSSLPARLSELAILVTARHWRSEYEWQAHRPIALQAGLSEAVVESIRLGQTPQIEKADELAVYRFATSLLETRKVEQAAYDNAVSAIGEDSVVDLVGVLGYYGLISMTINAFEIPAGGPAELT